jgi:hypothetical protein
VPQDIQWDLLSQGAGNIEEGTRSQRVTEWLKGVQGAGTIEQDTRGQRITEWLKGVQGGETAGLDGNTVIMIGEVNSALRVRMGVEVSIALQPRQLCRRWYLDRHRSLDQNEEVGTG